MSKLVDGFLASNKAAGNGVHLQEPTLNRYFRVFNPVTQSERFDPRGGLSASGCLNSQSWITSAFTIPV